VQREDGKNYYNGEMTHEKACGQKSKYRGPNGAYNQLHGEADFMIS